MTDQQSTQITNMRESGLGYSTIANQIGLPKECVKSYCRTHGLTGRRSSSHVDKEAGSNTCRTCGRYLQHAPGKRKKQYCSDACRMDWWNAHQDKVKRKAYYSFTCAECGKTFSSYGNAKRVYCSHSCYITARFSKGEK